MRSQNKKVWEALLQNIACSAYSFDLIELFYCFCRHDSLSPNSRRFSKNDALKISDPQSAATASANKEQQNKRKSDDSD